MAWLTVRNIDALFFLLKNRKTGLVTQIDSHFSAIQYRAFMLSCKQTDLENLSRKLILKISQEKRSWKQPKKTEYLELFLKNIKFHGNRD